MNSLVMTWLIKSWRHISTNRTYLFLQTTKVIWDAVKKSIRIFQSASQAFEIKTVEGDAARKHGHNQIL